MNPLDRFFKNKLSEPHAYPGMEDQWAEIEQLLDEQKPVAWWQNRRLIGAVLFALLLALLSIRISHSVEKQAEEQAADPISEDIRNSSPSVHANLPQKQKSIKPKNKDEHLNPSTLNAQPSTLNPQRSTLTPKPSTLNAKPSTLNAKPSTLNPKQSTLNSKLSTVNSKLKIEIRHLQAPASNARIPMIVPLRHTQFGASLEAGVNFVSAQPQADLAALAFAERRLTDGLSAQLGMGLARRGLYKMPAGSAVQEAYGLAYYRSDLVFQADAVYLLRAALGLRWQQSQRQSWTIGLRASYLTGVRGAMYERYYPPTETALSQAELQDFEHTLQAYYQRGGEGEKPRFYRESLLERGWLSTDGWQQYGLEISLSWRLHLQRVPDVGLYAGYALPAGPGNYRWNKGATVGLLLFF